MEPIKYINILLASCISAFAGGYTFQEAMGNDLVVRSIRLIDSRGKVRIYLNAADDVGVARIAIGDRGELTLGDGVRIGSTDVWSSISLTSNNKNEITKVNSRNSASISVGPSNSQVRARSEILSNPNQMLGDSLNSVIEANPSNTCMRTESTSYDITGTGKKSEVKACARFLLPQEENTTFSIEPSSLKLLDESKTLRLSLGIDRGDGLGSLSIFDANSAYTPKLVIGRTKLLAPSGEETITPYNGITFFDAQNKLSRRLP